jgi:hypothetical protein
MRNHLTLHKVLPEATEPTGMIELIELIELMMDKEDSGSDISKDLGQG